MSPEGDLLQLTQQERSFHDNVREAPCCRRPHPELFNPSPNPELHSSVWRKMVVQWCYDVVDHIQADREIVYVTVNILDRFLALQVSSPSPIRNYLTNRKDYEAAVMASLLITLKLEGISTISIRDLTKMGKHSVTSKDIVKAGEDIAEHLKWNKQIPTAAKFAHAMVDLLPPSVGRETRQTLFEECIFSIELSVQDKKCCSKLPSLVAWMVLDNAMKSEGLPQNTITSFGANVARITGLKYNQSIHDIIDCLRGRSISQQNHQETMPTQGCNIIPIDNESDCPKPSRLTLVATPIHEINVISMDDIREHSHSVTISSSRPIGTNKRCVEEEPTLTRSKRVRAF